MSTTESLRTNILLNDAIQCQYEYEWRTSVEERKRKGQFFTPSGVCQFMASLFNDDFPKSFRLLDPGAGAGSVTAAVCDRLLCVSGCLEVDLHLFENDPVVVPVLRETIARCAESLRAAGHSVRYTIYEKDFILDAASTVFGEPSLFGSADFGRFDAAIMNPPYFKLAKDSVYARVMQDVVHGQPNIYAFFLAAGAEMLRPGGRLVAITPRSFCSGLYFKEFRNWFSERMSLNRIHLFESRTDTFRDVLQESIVSQWHKSAEAATSITISTSFGRDVFDSNVERELPREAIIDNSGGASVIRIPGSHEDSAIVEFVESWQERFVGLGLRVSTGPVVTFRARQFLLDEMNGGDAVPLLSVFNVRPFDTHWPVIHKKQSIAFRVCQDSRRLLLPSRNYVLLRRFSAKEERRRLTASCLVESEYRWPFVALENHLNYVYHATRELSLDEVFGLAALFNSALLDRYFRTISGNTQVNATEIRTMPMPALDLIANIGQSVRSLDARTPSAVEAIVLGELGVDGSLGSHLLDAAS